MRRIGRAGWLLVAAWVAIGPSSTRSDEAPKVDPKAEAVDRILMEWHSHASKLKSIDAKFRRTEHSRDFGDSKSVGRAVLVAPNLGMIESAEIDETGKPAAIKSRLTWTEEYCLNFERETSTVYRSWRADPTTPPADLSLPFLFGWSVERAKSEHDWEILKEDDSIAFLQATRRKTSKAWFAVAVNRFIIELDKQTYLPRRVIVPNKASSDRTVYEVIDLKTNAEFDLHELKDPCLDAWRITDIPDFSTGPKASRQTIPGPTR